ncbi:AraC family transcriptional regulator [Caldalkalibacillus salinus]|uniref:AraC family transcriptional regulator n=1 Tax=Caldalkalibacillus salinus TaxID=2803787 RepID=UPI00192096E8|nr:AraC family transcriptional regulator [Caldalkalibacillus salinus]
MRTSLKLLKRFKAKVSDRWSRAYFRKNFVLILFITAIPGLITGICIYLFVVGQVEDELTELHQNQIDQSVSYLNDQLNILEYTISHWAFEPNFGASIEDIDFIKDFRQTYTIEKTLIMMQSYNPLIDKVKLFVQKDDSVLFDTNYGTVKNQQERDFFQSLFNHERNIYWLEHARKDIFATQDRLGIQARLDTQHSLGTEDSLSHNDPSFALIHHIPGTSHAPYGLIYVTLNRDKLVKMLDNLTPYNQGISFILGQENQVLISSNTDHSYQLEHALRKRINDLQENDHAFQFDWHGHTYSVSFGKMERLNSEWTYVSAAPMSSITSPVVFISKLIVFVSMTGLGLAVILTWFVSRKIYHPVGQLLKHLTVDKSEADTAKHTDEFKLIEEKWQELSYKSELLQNRITAHLPQLSNGFLLQLIQGYLYHYTEEDLRARMESYGWDTKDKQFIVINAQLTGCYQSIGNDISDANNDESLVTFVAANMIEEIAEDFFQQSHVINFHDLSVGIILVYASNVSIQHDLDQFVKAITKAVNQNIDSPLTVILSSPTTQVKKIAHLFEEVAQAKGYRNFDNENQVINLQDVGAYHSTQHIYYPFAIEKEVIQAVRMGHIEEVEGLIRAFIRELTEKGVTELNIQPGVFQLFGSLQHEILHTGIHPYQLFNGRNMLEELSLIREPERIIQWFNEEVIEPYIQEINNRTNIQSKQLVEKVITMIKTQYMEDISLEYCADEVGTYPYTLSKAFKQVTGVNFIDYLTQLRIDKAKDMLINTDLKISDISAKVGYRHSYFNRIFKKQTGVPPSQFRKTHWDTHAVSAKVSNK